MTEEKKDLDGEVYKILAETGLLYLSGMFAVEEVGIREFVELREDHLQQMGIKKLGHRQKILQAIKTYKKEYTGEHTEKGETQKGR